MIKNPPIIKKVVREMGGTFEKVIPERGYFYIKLRGRRIFVSRKFKIASTLTSGGEITKFKDLTYLLLKENGLPTPKTLCFYRKSIKEADLNKKLNSFKYPAIIKDARGSNSKGIFPNIKNKTAAKKVFLSEIKKYPSLIIQEMVFGREFRILILKDRIIGALELIPPRVFGDGKSSVRKLILQKQKNTTRKTAFDSFLNELLKKQGFTLKSVPLEGEEVYIKNSSCLAEGGETRDVTSLVNEEIRKICVKAARVTEKYLAGIDVICEDISKKKNEQNFNILEINGKPDLYIHYNPTHGESRDVIKEILNFILRLK